MLIGTGVLPCFPIPFLTIAYYDTSDVEIHWSARKHGVADAAILHALHHAVTAIDLDPDTDPPKVLAIGPTMRATCWRSSGSSSPMMSIW